MKKLLIVLTTLFAAVACTSIENTSAEATSSAQSFVSADTSADGYNHGQYAPYDSTQHSVGSVNIPNGFSPVYYENIGRHGARAATSSSKIDSTISFYNAAKKANALKPSAANFGSDLSRVKRAQSSVGSGNLSSVGASEWYNIGKRSVSAYPEFWEYADRSKGNVDFVASSASRAKNSATNFFRGSDSQSKSNGWDYNNTSRKTNDSQLRLSNSMSSSGQREWDKINNSSATTAAADQALKHLYSDSYVNKMSRSSKVSAARNLWETVAIAPGLVSNGAVSLDQYLPESSANQLAYVNDAVAFYKYGPGISGSNTSFKKAVVVRDNFFRVVDNRLFEGGKSIATFRFSHGETTMPFYGILRLNPQATTSNVFTYASTQWSGNDEAKYATNLDWLVVAKGKPSKASGSVLVTMRVNERPTKFSAACAKYEVLPYWYDYAGLKKCVARS